MAFPERIVPPVISHRALAPSSWARTLISVQPLLAPAAAAWLSYVALAVLIQSPAFRVYDAGFLPDSTFIRSAASALAPDTLLSPSGSTGRTWAAMLIYGCIIAVALASWCWAIRVARSLELVSVWPVLALSALIMTPVVAFPGLLSDDLYLYNLYGRTISAYGANPILHPPMSFPNDAHLDWVHWKELPSSYGSIWLMFSALLSGIAGESLTTVVVVYRVAAAALHLIVVTVVWRVLRDSSSGGAAAGLIFYAWNPLVLVEVVGNAHNDVLVALFAVLLVAAATRRAWGAAAFFGACAVLVKPFAVLLAPALVRRMIEQIRPGSLVPQLAMVAAVGAATIIAVSLPLWAGAALFWNIQNNPASHMYTNTLWELISEAGPAWLGVTTVAIQHPYLDVLRVACFLAGAAWVLTRRASARDVPRVALRLWLVFCLTACWVWPWYFVPALALAPLAGRAALPAAMGLTLGGLLFWAIWPERPSWALESFFTFRSLALFGPVLVLSTWAAARSATFAALGLQGKARSGGADTVDVQLQTAEG